MRTAKVQPDDTERLPPRRAQGRLDQRPPVSVIDIGSNSIRLVVYEGASRSPTPLFNEKVACGLGRSVAAGGTLSGDSVPRALEAISRFRALSHQLGAGRPWVVATAAVRDAENAAWFVRQVETTCGAKVMLLSGQREAELAAMGIQSGFHHPDGIAGDLGGGSLELVEVSTQGLTAAVTLPLGGLRLAQRSGGAMDKAAKLIGSDLDTVPWLKRGAKRTFFAVGGTWRNLAILHMEETGYPLHITHGYRIDAGTAIKFCEQIAEGRKLRNTDLSRISAARREVLPLGAAVLKQVLQRLSATDVVFSVHGIREGLIYAMLPVAERRRDPLLAYCEDSAILRSRSPLHGQELCTWTDQLFKVASVKETPVQARLRHATCLLSDISWRAHPDYRGEQSVDLIARASLSGVDHAERVFIALAVCFRHIGDAPLAASDAGLLQLLNPAEQKRAMLVGAAIRAIHMLSAGADGVILRTPVSAEGKKLVLTIPKDLAVLTGERLRKRFSFVAELLGRTAEIRFGGR
jgi:exopolyphosphatase / guanosine-5'-triphosphate,3'-diphosphate pyrophosphatase